MTPCQWVPASRHCFETSGKDHSVMRRRIPGTESSATSRENANTRKKFISPAGVAVFWNYCCFDTFICHCMCYTNLLLHRHCPHSSYFICKCRRKFVGLLIFQSITNKLQRYTVCLFPSTTLHVSGGSSAHHQEHKTVSTASGICQTVTAICRCRGRVQNLPR